MKKNNMGKSKPNNQVYKLVDVDQSSEEEHSYEAMYGTYKYMGFESLSPPDRNITVKGDDAVLKELHNALFWSTLIQDKVMYYIENVLKYKTHKKKNKKGKIKRRYNTLSLADIKTFLKEHNPRLWAHGNEEWITDTIKYTKNLYMLALSPDKDFDVAAVKRNAQCIVFYGKTSDVEVDAFTGTITIPHMCGKGTFTFKTDGMTKQRENIVKIKIKKDPLNDTSLQVHIRHGDDVSDEVPYLQPEVQVDKVEVDEVSDKWEKLFS